MNHQTTRSLPILLAMALSGCAVAEETPSSWNLGTDDAISWETVHVLSRSSSDSIADEYATKEVSPVLSFRCTDGGDGSVSMQIDWQRFISSFNTEAGFRVDDGTRDWIKMSVDDSNKVTLSRSSEDVVRLMDSMSAGSSLNVEIVPYSESAVSVTFPLGDFPDAMDGLRQACEQ